MKNILFLVPVLALAACAPMMGVKPTLYRASSSDVLAAVAQNCAQIQPNAGYNYLSVTTITPTLVTCSAAPVGGIQFLNVITGKDNTNYVVTFTALQSANITSVAGGGNQTDRSVVEKLFSILDKQFERVPN